MTSNTTFSAASFNIDTLDTYNKSQLVEIVQHLHSVNSAPRSNRKNEVLEQLRNIEATTIAQLAEILNTTSKNISSLLTYLRKDGYIIHRDHIGRVYLTDRNQIITQATNTTNTTDEQN